MRKKAQNRYRAKLESYLRNPLETELKSGQSLSKFMLDQGALPEEIVRFHKQVLSTYLPDIPEEVLLSLDFLSEVLVGYGQEYHEYRDLQEKQIQLQSEIEVAASMQQTLLPPVPQELSGIELGSISVAANKMSGDYYHFFEDPNGYLGVAIADIIGKGIPAAMCMSMIKYAIESLPEQRMDPHMLLESINRVVEKNVDPSMFITMIYGSYDLNEHTFSYATAGHEPGLYYSMKEDRFTDLESKGVVLGLFKHSEYTDFEKNVEPGDMLILFSDGVTESKKDGQFVEREGLVKLIRQYIHLPAQQIVEKIHQTMLDWADDELSDDQTIVIIRRMF